MLLLLSCPSLHHICMWNGEDEDEGAEVEGWGIREACVYRWDRAVQLHSVKLCRLLLLLLLLLRCCCCCCCTVIGETRHCCCCRIKTQEGKEMSGMWNHSIKLNERKVGKDFQEFFTFLLNYKIGRLTFFYFFLSMMNLQSWSLKDFWKHKNKNRFWTTSYFQLKKWKYENTKIQTSCLYFWVIELL